ncbi:P22 phage major capsid protein family protein [Massilia varians]|uniref:P22 phage major capsid protein family protein n=1 Tax=Massilia varians TaxID=457921 RepID=UPI002557AF7E|nr:P22 phage major capsid protein family protein [Massilia varians]MDK6077933.1 P22 phage major capsid protein family protein [Massilia varians]
MKKLHTLAAACAAALSAHYDRAALYARATARWARLNIGISMHNFLGSQGLIMGANTFSKEERVMFDKVIEGFDDGLITGKLATKYDPLPDQQMQQVGDRVWIPAPYISASYDGFDQTGNFGDVTGLSIPISIGYHKSANGKMTSKDLRNPSELERYGKAAKQKLASDINYALFMTAAMQGSQFIKRPGNATGFDDIAQADAQMTEQGVPLAERKALLAPRIYNAMAGNLAKPQTSGLPQTMNAFQKAFVGDVAGFDTYKNDQSIRLGAATGGVTTVNGANQSIIPKSTSTAPGTGESDNVDNRYSDLVVTAAAYANIKAGDAFTIAGVNSVHMISKQDTGQLQTFRVIGKPGANTIRIAPAIVSVAGASKAEKEYGNVTAAPANGAAITWLNTTTAELNPFFVKDNLLLIPGSFAVEEGAGWLTMRAMTDLGIAITYVRQAEINDLTMKFRWDIDFGTALTNPQMGGAIAFGQA